MISRTEKSLKSIHFDSYTYDLDNSELKQDGSAIRLRPKANQFLKLIIEADGKVVSHEKLYSTIWKGRVVQRMDGLHQLAKDVRIALSDCASDPVINIPGVGYRFAAAIHAPGAGKKTHAVPANMAYLGGLATLPAAFVIYCVMIAVGILN